MSKTDLPQTKNQRHGLDVDSFYQTLYENIPERFLGRLHGRLLGHSVERSNQRSTKEKECGSIEFIVAYSGGVDSQVLLHLLVKVKSRLQQALSIRIIIRPIYINHHLQEAASDWQVFCESEAHKLGLVCQTIDVNIEDKTRNIEAQARSKRYQALLSQMSGDSVLLTGHHLTDQSETFFLNLMRGSGLDGLTAMSSNRAMPESNKSMSSCPVIRPLLAFTQEEIKDCAIRHQWSWVDDESNNDKRYDRNYLRHHLLPVLKSRWPHYQSNIAHSIEHLQDVRLVMERYLEDKVKQCAMARADLSSCIDNLDNVLNLNNFIGFDASEVRLIIRHWFSRYAFNKSAENHVLFEQNHSFNGKSIISRNNLEIILHFVTKYQHYKDRLSNEATHPIDENSPISDEVNNQEHQLPSLKLAINDCIIVNNNNELYILPQSICNSNRNNNIAVKAINAMAAFNEVVNCHNGLQLSFNALINNDNKNINAKGFSVIGAYGLSVPKSDVNLRWQSRKGGEWFVASNGSRKPLKKIWQTSRIPYWEKSSIPLLFYKNIVVWVPGIEINVNQAKKINAQLGQEIWCLGQGYQPRILFNPQILLDEIG